MADNNFGRFSSYIRKHWEDKGHEVRFEGGASEVLYEWCDLYYVEFFDHNIHYLYGWARDHPDAKKPVIVVRGIDWDIWVGMARDPLIAHWVDHVITITPHIREKMIAENPGYIPEKVHLIRCGVDTEKFAWKNPSGGTKIAMPINEIDWVLKNGLEGLKIFAMLCKRDPRPWELHVRGKYCQEKYLRVAFDDFIEKTGIKDRVFIYEQPVPDMNEFFEDKDYVLVPSLKEAFSYVTAEAVCKGIKPILHNWYHAEDTWPKEWLYLTPDEAVQRILDGYTEEDSLNYRKFIVENYTLQKMFDAYDELLGT
jgi:glycosyltransferase involved in cell wall biosynthesis